MKITVNKSLWTLSSLYKTHKKPSWREQAAHIEQRLHSLQGLLDNLKKRIGDKLANLKQKLDFKNQLKLVIDEHGQLSNVPTYQLSKAVSDEVHKMFNKSQSEKWLQSSQLTMILWDGIINKTSKYFRNVSDSLLDSFDTSLVNVVVDDCQWSQKLKNQGIFVSGSRAQIKQPFKEDWGVVLADIVLDPTVAPKYEWTIHSKNSAHKFCLGVCLQDKAKEQQFKGCEFLSLCGHGHYIFDVGENNNFVNNSISEAYNQKFKYTIDNTLPVTISVDFSNKTIHLKQKDKMLMKMPIEIPQQKMRPVLWNQGINIGQFTIANMSISKL